MSGLTIYQIAEKAGVSIATVSRAINPRTRPRVAPATLEKIDSLIQRHRYIPNQAARGLTRSGFRTLGVILPHGRGIFLDDYYARILSGISDAMLDSPYRFKLLMLKERDPENLRYDFRAADGVDGLIIAHWHVYFDSKKDLNRLNLPVVIIGDPEEGIRGHFVSADHGRGGEMAARYLLEKGHRQFWLLTGPANSVDSNLRRDGFIAELKKAGIELPEDNILCGHFQENLAREMIQPHLKKGMKETAVFCLNDKMAFGVLRALRDAGLSCPEDVSVLGFDDEKAAAQMQPALTTFHVPIEEIAAEGCRHLMDFLENPSTTGFSRREKCFHAPHLMERGSVCSVK